MLMPSGCATVVIESIYNSYMKIIAESSSTRTEWALVDGESIVEHAYTQGLNPYFQSRREISHSIRLELPEAFFRRRWEHVYFYGAGCANPEKTKIIQSSLIAQFKTLVTVYSDLLGAARGILGNESGIACILGTGSNSCLYDGKDIVAHVRPLGFILGDEGSGAYLGKMFVSDCLKNIAPAELRDAFYASVSLQPDEIMDAVYTNPHPNRSLSTFSRFLAGHLADEYVYQLVYNAFLRFFTRNVAAYDYRGNQICCVGATGCIFESVLRHVAADFGVEIRKIERTSLPGLVMYHAANG